MLHPGSVRQDTWLARIPHDSGRMLCAYGLLATATLAGAIWIAAHAAITPAEHTAGLFVHLASLVLGFGGVLVADTFVLRWLAGRATLADTLRIVSALHMPIWLGLAGLVASGCVLEPNLSSAMTQTKMGLVLVLTLNGIQAWAFGRRLHKRGDAPLTPGLLAWGVATGLISQVCWWGATAIGFVNAQH
ncbi:hypothetical protein [Nocardia inohanensis]|uniref:hypothetical protein n=1 Tax=Nocardia inohanensis TaxID=209246 RepID=UPI000A471520|nr:hypothetical protein [Nocardia inohanensis]